MQDRAPSPLDIRESWLWAMQRGNFSQAWKISDTALAFRSLEPEAQAHLPLHFRDVWKGDPIDDKILLVRCHHGLGDTLQFIRCCAIARRRARRLSLKVQKELLPLLSLSKIAGVDEMLPLESPDPFFEIDAEIMELPFIERVSLAEIPNDIPYLWLPSPAIKTAKTFKIGVAWAAGDFIPERNLPDTVAVNFLDHLPKDDCEFFCLQRGRCAPFDFKNGSEAPADIMGTAQLIKSMDLVITVDTMIAHLAGALGVPVWLLLHSSSDWRWMLDRSDSPWYPTMRLFRQSQAGDWSDPLRHLRSALEWTLSLRPKNCAPLKGD
jgi:hypothetical protein